MKSNAAQCKVACPTLSLNGEDGSQSPDAVTPWLLLAHQLSDVTIIILLW